MSSPPSTPNRRRRRLVVTLAVLAVGLCWSCWPRGDARFVGTWSVKFEDAPDFQGTLTLDSDGKGFWPATGGTSKVHFPWLVRGNVFTYGYRAKTRLWWTIHELSTSVTGGVRDVDSINDFEILDTNRDQIRLRPNQIKGADGRPATMVLIRIPE